MVVVVSLEAVVESESESAPGAQPPADTDSAAASDTAATAGGHRRIPNMSRPR